MPRVSVIVPTYNRTHLIGETIRSVLNQSFRTIELIVMDDGSTDNTKEIISGFGDSVRYFHQENKGRSIARNEGFKAARGEYICFLDSDDLLAPRKLERQVALLNAKGQLGFVYCDYQFIDQTGGSLPKPQIYAKHPLQRGWIFRHLLYFDFIPLPTILIRRQCLEEEGLFDRLMGHAEDFDWLLRLSKRYETDYIPEPLCLIRTHSGNTSMTAIADATIEVLTKHLFLVDTKTVLGKDWRRVYFDCYFTVANFYYNRRDMGSARKYFFEALRASPMEKPAPDVLSLIFRTLLGSRFLDTFRRARDQFARH